MLGFVNIYKPAGMSSALAVSLVKRKAGCKCGHMGTLDPLASGVLPIGFESANRLFRFLLDKRKIYEAVFDFGFSTPSHDLETEVSLYADYLPTPEQITSVIPSFVGSVEQVPPKFSAKMVDGRRSYKLARRGVEVELQPKRVEIFGIELLERVSESAYKFKIECGGGTYIRALARDMGLCFSCPATMIKLERTACGAFTKQNSVTPDELAEADSLERFIIKPEDAVDFPKLNLSALEAERLLNGLYDDYALSDGLYRVYASGEFRGVGEILSGKLKMKAYVWNGRKISND